MLESGWKNALRIFTLLGFSLLLGLVASEFAF